MADFLPWFPFDFDAFVEGTPLWSAEERWAYLCLLREQWRRGWLPNEPHRLHRFTEMTAARFKRTWAERLADKFPAIQGDSEKLANPRMAEERAKEVVKVAQARAAGGAGGRARAASAQASGQASASIPLAETADNVKRPLDTEDRNTGSYMTKPTAAGARVHGQAGAREICLALVSTNSRAGAMGGDLLAPRMAEMLAATPEAAADPADYARRACDAYDALRVSWAPGKRPGWDAEALRRHWPTIGRILAGADPWPAPWTPEAPKPTRTPGYQPPAPKGGSIIAGDG